MCQWTVYEASGTKSRAVKPVMFTILCWLTTYLLSAIPCCVCACSFGLSAHQDHTRSHLRRCTHAPQQSPLMSWTIRR